MMNAYNRLNGVYCGENKTLLTRILREEWGFDGLVVSDWNAVDNRTAGMLAGARSRDARLVAAINDRKLIAAVKSGALPMEALDRAACRVTELALRGAANGREGFRYDADAHHRLAVDAAAQSAVLLKNDGNLLPGHVKQKGGGHSARLPKHRGIRARAAPRSTRSVLTPRGMRWRSLGLSAQYAPGYSLSNPTPKEKQEALIREACDAAKDRDIVYIFAGLPEGYESEGFDRADLALPPRARPADRGGRAR